MERRNSIIKRTFEQGGKEIIVSTDSVEYMEEQEGRYETDSDIQVDKGGQKDRWRPLRENQQEGSS
jgi:hypothetical protein